jgi:nitrite reductase/ring-hydroxylating ferredoxin subunit
MGGKIYGGAAVIKTNEQPDNVLVETDSGFTVSCKNLVFATNAPSNHQIKIHTKEAAYRSYMIGLKIKKDIFPKILLWDTEDPYHYVRVQSEKDHDVILIGGCDHRVGQEDASKDYFEELKFWAQDRLGMSGEMIYKWSGQIIETLDGLAYIGKSPGSTNTYEVSGDSGHGLTHGTIAGIIISDLILGNHNSWIELYNPARKNIHSIVTFVKENIQGVSQNIDWITPGDVKSEADMPNDSGAIIRDGIEKIAVYKDASGNLHKCSAVCPHLGALVRWNHLEKTWDCPFHGSRFSIDGEVLNGPTNDGLELVNKNKIR